MISLNLIIKFTLVDLISYLLKLLKIKLFKIYIYFNKILYFIDETNFELFALKIYFSWDERRKIMKEKEH